MAVTTGTTLLTGDSAAVVRRFVIEGGTPLRGDVDISGSKNAALPLLAATLLTSDEMVLNNVPRLSDIQIMVQLLQALGADVEYETARRRVTVRAREIHTLTPPPELVEAMRASFLVTGPLLARFGEVTARMPGGCKLGARPVDVDMRGFAKLGAEVRSTADSVTAKSASGGLKAAEIYMDYPSHTGTENLLMAAVLGGGVTTIVNASCEPEVVALGAMLNRMGARITGLGSPQLQIVGVNRLTGVSETVPPDRLEAGTYAIAAVITGGEVRINQARSDDMLPVRVKLEEAGATIWSRGDSMLVQSRGKLGAVEIQTMPFPGFPTDLQAAFAALMTQATGLSRIKERVFEDRMRYTDQLIRMGANIKVDKYGADKYGSVAEITGPTPLHGACVQALDIRGGAGVVLAGLIAEGMTTVEHVEHLDRGYERMVDKLQSLGATISEQTANA